MFIRMFRNTDRFIASRAYDINQSYQLSEAIVSPKKTEELDSDTENTEPKYTSDDEKYDEYTKLLKAEVLETKKFNCQWKFPNSPGKENGEYFSNWSFCTYLRKNDESSKVLHFQGVSKRPYISSSSYTEFSPYQWTTEKSEKQKFTIPKTPYKVLDAPDLKDDFYSNLLDWSSNDIIAVGLRKFLYLWNAKTAKISKLSEEKQIDSFITCLWFDKEGKSLIQGNSKGRIRYWDVKQQHAVLDFESSDNGFSKTSELLGEFYDHSTRVGVVSLNESLLASGSKDNSISLRDIRQNPNLYTGLFGHRQEVVGLKWDESGNNLASGGNDNKLLIWDIRMGFKPKLVLKGHEAAVKGIAWSPHKENICISGGGTADRKIRFWDILTGKEINCIDSEAQVCNLQFSQNNNQFVSTHGYSPKSKIQNQIYIWSWNDSKYFYA